jgi:hypothetical protein
MFFSVKETGLSRRLRHKDTAESLGTMEGEMKRAEEEIKRRKIEQEERRNEESMKTK